MRGPNRKEGHEFFLILLVFTLFACGSADDENEVLEKAQEEQEEEREIQREEGRYSAILRPVNPDVEEGRGMANITIRDDSFAIQVKMDKVPSNVLHPQNIYLGTSCPNWDNDANKDGFIDVREGYSSYGKILIPLDSNLSSQIEGQGLYPAANRFGKYYYRRSTSRTELMSDLRAVDLGLNSDFSKLTSNEPLNLSGKVLVVHGVQGYLDLPSSVATAWGEPNYRTMPVACGKIIRLNSRDDREDVLPSVSRRPPRELPTTLTTTTTITTTITSESDESETTSDYKNPETSSDDSFLDDDEGYLGIEE